MGAEERLSVECLDTYDQRWATLGQVWLRLPRGPVRVAPPSLFPLSTDFGEFGLQAPVSQGKVVLSLRSVAWEVPNRPVLEGQIIRSQRQSWLALRSDDEERLSVLEKVLLSEGMALFPAEQPTWLVSKRTPFLGPRDWAPLEGQQDAPATLVDRIVDSFRVARQYEPGIRQNLDTECLHQYRVHVRRARSWCSLGVLWHGVPEWRRLKIVLRRLQQETNSLRDLDVLALDLPALRAGLLWGQGSYLEGWQAETETARRAEQQRVCRWLESPEYRHLCSEIEPLCEALRSLGEARSMSQVTEVAFGSVARRLRKDLKVLGADPSDDALHELRIVSKRLRYVLEGLGSLIERERFLGDALKEAQKALGEFQDSSVLIGRLREQITSVRSPKSPIDALSFGLLLGSLAAEHALQKRHAAKAASQLGKKAFLQALESHCAT